jgi:hypothetical protein
LSCFWGVGSGEGTSAALLAFRASKALFCLDNLKTLFQPTPMLLPALIPRRTAILERLQERERRKTLDGDVERPAPRQRCCKALENLGANRE